MVLPTIHHERGHKHWTNFSQTYWLALYKNQQVPQNIQQKQCKVSYSCSPNFASMIKLLHNNRILSEEKTQDQPKCNCWQKDTCPLEGNCLDKELIYQCNLKENTTSDGVNYNNLTENTFKDRFYEHHNSFKYQGKETYTELSKHIWEMKRKDI